MLNINKTISLPLLLPRTAAAPALTESQTLFGRLASAYWLTEVLSAGLANRWRRECVRRLQLQPGMQVADVMTGGGQAWPFILEQIGATGKLYAADNCAAMLRQARHKAKQLPQYQLSLLQADVLDSPLPTAEFDAVVCCFGVKTLSDEELQTFCLEMRRVLKLGGQLAVVEISEPWHPMLRRAFGSFLKTVVPAVAGAFYPAAKNSFRKLSFYQARFGSCRRLVQLLQEAGFKVEEFSLSGGMATGVVAKFR